VEGDVSQQARPEFKAEVTIGKGMRRIEPRGVVTISGGHLTLSRHTGEIIVDAPIADIRVSRHRLSAGAAAKISIGDDYYTIQPTGRGVTGAPGSAVSTGKSMMTLKRGRELTKAFLVAVEAAQGDAGQ
jgi:hypothetical protein